MYAALSCSIPLNCLPSLFSRSFSFSHFESLICMSKEFLRLNPKAEYPTVLPAHTEQPLDPHRPQSRRGFSLGTTEPLSLVARILVVWILCQQQTAQLRALLLSRAHFNASLIFDLISVKIMRTSRSHRFKLGRFISLLCSQTLLVLSS